MPETDPFCTSMRDEEDSYYRNNFPSPFDVPPPADANRVSEFRKLEGLVHKFSGEEEDFHAWMALYVPVVHRARCPVVWKAAILCKGLDTKNPTLKNIVASGGATKEDYAEMIHRLMRAFAHPQGLVAAKLRALESVTFVQEGDHDKMEEWLIKMEAFLTAARARGMSADIFSVQLYEDNFTRMDDNLANNYLMWASMKDLPNNSVTICAWLEEKVKHAKQMKRRKETLDTRAFYINRARPRSSPPGKRSPRGAHTGRSRAESYEPKHRRKRNPCPLDGAYHPLETCDDFKSMAPKERRQMCREDKRCYGCLVLGHNIGDCNKDIRCAHCTHKHHTLLHGSGSGRRGVRRTTTNHRAMLTEAQEAEEEDSWSESSEPEEPISTQVYKVEKHDQKQKIVLQTVPIDAYNGTQKIQLNCLLDQGATGAFLSRRAAEALNLTGYMAQARVTGFDGAVTEGRVLIASLQIAAQDAKRKHWIQVQVSKDPAGSYVPYDWTKTQHKYEHIKNLPVKPPVPGKAVDIMLGLDTPELLQSLVPDRGGRGGQPLARYTRLGWVIGGPTRDREAANTRVNFAFRTTPWTPRTLESSQWATYSFKTAPEDAREDSISKRSQEEDITRTLIRMWEVSSALGKSVASVQDERVFKFLGENLEKEGKKYKLPTIWKPGQPVINNNYKYAVTRLDSIIKSKQFRDRDIRKEYSSQIKDWEKQGYTEVVETNTPAEDKAYYLPHFAVVRMDKTTSKVRIVMDAAARPSRTGTQHSLNDCLLKGPKLVNELPIVLLRYRLREVSLAADIKKMFFQIYMREEDRDMHRFVWKDEEGQKIYRWAVHPFGSAASPCVAIFTIKEHAKRLRQKYPRAAETVIKSTLVDDNLDSCRTEEEAIELGKQLVGLFEEAGMELGKIISNSKAVMETFPKKMRADSVDVAAFCTQDLDTPVVKSLGIVYLAGEDCFSFSMPTPKPTVWTKRKILQHKAKLYDPHGLISPHVVRAGIILQKVWRSKTDWDEPVKEEILKEWLEWLKATEELPKLRVPRCVTKDSKLEARYHVFCDASADAYAAAAYYVTKEESRLIASKTKVSPLKAISIPRLELLAAELVLDMTKFIKDTVDTSEQEFHYWSDSMNVLAWLETESRSLHEFVGNRVAKITEETKPHQWHWVNTEDNPADIPSRGVKADKLINNELWWKGPKFLLRPPSSWPQRPKPKTIPEDARLEIKKSMAFQADTNTVQIADRYDASSNPWQHVQTTSWKRSLRSFVRCTRWRRPREHRGEPPTQRELQRMENILIKSMQESSLRKSWQQITVGKALHRDSPVTKLDPIIDQLGAMRVGGRLRDAKFLPFDQRHQLIVPKDHPWTDAIIEQAHKDGLHQGAAHVAVLLRKRLWVIHGGQKIRSVLTRCVDCKRQRAAQQPQRMAPVVEDRLPETRCQPFTYTALDAAGPYYGM